MVVQGPERTEDVSYAIMSYVGVGPLRLGMTRADIHRLLGEEATSFRRAPTIIPDEIPQDRYANRGIFIDYSPLGLCRSIEFAGPAAPSWRGEPLLGRPYREVRALFTVWDPALKEDGAGFTSLELGIGVYAPVAKDHPDDPVEGVIVFEKGYYQGN